MFGIPVWAGWLIGALVLTGGAFYSGWHEKSLRDQADLLKAEQLIQLQTVQTEQITAEVSQVAETHQIQLASFTNALLIEVPHYVSAKADGACTVPLGLVELFNAAASGKDVPDAAGQSNDLPARVELHSVAASVAQNYGTCRSIREQLVDLQSWIAAQQKVQ